MSASLESLLSAIVGPTRATRLMTTLVVHSSLVVEQDLASRALIAQALNMLLFDDLISRVPAAALYVERCLANGDTILHDHGAVRTVDLAGMGALPAGQLALTRVLEPLGYTLHGTYPLDRLRMTGRSFAQADLPEDIAQFFISELHVDRFPADFAAAVTSVTKDSTDPLTPDAVALLSQLSSMGAIPFYQAVTLLPTLVSCFDRQHPAPALADYETLLTQSAEMAWIATEGNAFNHATDRVQDVEALTITQKALGQPMKDKVEVSGSGRVRQTAFTAARVLRDFRAADGTIVQREVPGSFLEFIARDYIPGEAVKTLDLAFDPSNAQAIFKMTPKLPDTLIPAEERVMPIDLLELPMPVVLRTESPLSDEELIQFSRRNKPYKIERNKEGELIIMTPVGGIGSTHEFMVGAAFARWLEETGDGMAFSRSVGFNLPDGSCLSPDGAWISSTRWTALTPAQQTGFPPLAPDFLIEVRSHTDRRSVLEEKMQLWMQNGVPLAWLIDPIQATVIIYQPGQPEQTLRRPELVEAGAPALGFKLRTSLLWTPQ